MQKPEKISLLFVCLGNICRSPLAEAIFLKHIKEQGHNDLFELDSAGTGAWHIGKPAHQQSIRAAQDRNLDLTFHRARQVSLDDFTKYNYIVAMDQSNYQDLRQLASKVTASSKILRIREFDHPGSSLDVPDPYYGGPEGFDEVYDLLDRCCKRLLQEIMLRADL